MIQRVWRWCAIGACLATLPCRASADTWTIANADAPLTVVRATSVYALQAGDALKPDDLLAGPAHGVVQLQNGDGTVLALAAGSHAMLEDGARGTRGAQITLLSGWLKIARTCAPPCAAAVVDTGRGAVTPGANAAAVLFAPDDAASPLAVFSESGTQTLAAKTGAATLPSGAFAQLFTRKTQQTSQANVQQSAPQITPRPTADFLAGMPVPFRDALQPIRVAPAADAPQPLRAATFDDVAPWLNSTVAERPRFATRFHTRLSDAAFRGAVGEHIGALPDWRVWLYPSANGSNGTNRAAAASRPRATSPGFFWSLFHHDSPTVSQH